MSMAPSLSERKPIPLLRKSSTSVIKCRILRPSRSNRHTTRMSPLVSDSRHFVSPGRSVFAPDTLSMKMAVFGMPCCWRASICRLKSWSSVDTRA